MAKRTTHGMHMSSSGSATALYRQVLGPAFDTLSPCLKAMHQGEKAQQWQGTANVSRGPGLVARLAANLFRFPKAGSDIPVTLTCSPEPGIERWVRSFGENTLATVQWVKREHGHTWLMERFGLATFALALVIEGDTLLFVPTHWYLAGIPMPRALLPSGRSYEAQAAGAFCFNIEINMPLLGPIVTYTGRLWPCGTPSEARDQ